MSGELQAFFSSDNANLLYMESFKQRMQRLRRRAGFKSQKAAADAIGCERGTVGMWEAPSSRVDSVGAEYLLDVARAYKVRPSYINSGKGDDGFPWADENVAPVILDPEIVADAASSLHEVFSEIGSAFQGVQDAPDLFVDLYHEFSAGTARPHRTAAKVIQWVARRRGKEQDVRVAPMPDEGSTSGNAGHRRKAKS